MRSLAHFLSYFSLKPAEMLRTNLTVPSAIKNSSPSLIFLFRSELRNEKKMWKISLSSGSIYEHINFCGGRKKVHQIDDEARLSCGTIVKIKHLSLTSLAFMQLVPGDDRAVGHICIRCIQRRILWKSTRKYPFLLFSEKC